jgi:hypothetical protein
LYTNRKKEAHPDFIPSKLHKWQKRYLRHRKPHERMFSSQN